MYAEVDFLLALITDDDWLGESAEQVYRDHEDALWTSHYALLELLLVAYREDLNVERVVADASELLEVRGDADLVLAAASYVSEQGLTPFDAVHAVAAGDSRSSPAIPRTTKSQNGCRWRTPTGSGPRAGRSSVSATGSRTPPSVTCVVTAPRVVLAAPDDLARRTTVGSVSGWLRARGWAGAAVIRLVLVLSRV